MVIRNYVTRAGPSRLRRFFLLMLLLVLVAFAGLLLERWQGRSALKAWKAQMAAKGESPDPQRLWPAMSPASVEFSKKLDETLRGLPPEVKSYAGSIPSIKQEEPGKYRRGSQEPLPSASFKDGPTNSWQDLDASIQQGQPAFVALRQLMKNPPSGIAYNISQALQNDSPPNFVNVRVGAQALHTAAMNALHKGDLAEAVEDLTALQGFVKLNADDPSFIAFMIRIAVLGLSIDVTWDALQATGWTEQQLVTLQKACQQNVLLPQMPKAIEANRINRLYELHWFRSHSYDEWIARRKPAAESLGFTIEDTKDPMGPGFWRRWVYHPIWSFAWADEEEFNYLQDTQPDVKAWRQAGWDGSLPQFEEQLAKNHRNYRPPRRSWRFYTLLPMYDPLPEPGGAAQVAGTYPYQDHARARTTAFKNLTLHDMMIGAIAIKRYELRYGKPPAALTQLTPEFLAAVPHDFMDGRSLKYRLNADNSFTLYSVGEDSRDDGGNPVSQTAAGKDQENSPWNGRDWVWPRSVASAAVPKT